MNNINQTSSITPHINDVDAGIDKNQDHKAPVSFLSKIKTATERDKTSTVIIAAATSLFAITAGGIITCGVGLYNDDYNMAKESILFALQATITNICLTIAACAHNPLTRNEH